ncbi:MAG TPA: hypothetical protein VFA10_17795 [Ktedonobacteraceae bacterium]|nr:hypothetical protein [Ktedonobacteraceae bacterium]
MPQRHTRYAPVPEYTPLHITATGTLVPVGNCVNTTSSTTITAGSNVVVTPASMNGIYVGQKLNFANGTGTAETVVVTATTSTTFTATFVNNHSGAYTITSMSGTFLGKLVINQPGTSVSITLYNGSPNTLPKAGAAFAVLSGFSAGQAIPFDCSCDAGLFYSLTGTPGDYTLTYLDQAAA